MATHDTHDTHDTDDTGATADEPTPAAPTWDDAVEELYGLLRDDVIPRRDELAKQARAAGDRETAAAILRLRKPSAAAWLANMLAREHPDEIAALEDLGASMRAAQERLEGDALRRLSRQRHELVHALVERARRIAREDGVRVGDTVVRELERTITAALADAEAARALAAGRLVTALEPGAGLGAAAASAPPSGPAPAPRPARRRSPRIAAPATSGATSAPAGEDGAAAQRPTTDGRAERREREERERAERAERAEREERARVERERLEGVLAGARTETARADEAVETARATATTAASELEEATGTVTALRERLAVAEEADRAARDRAAAADRDAAARARDAEDAAARVRRAERDLAEHERS